MDDGPDQRGSSRIFLRGPRLSARGECCWSRPNRGLSRSWRRNIDPAGPIARRNISQFKPSSERVRAIAVENIEGESRHASRQSVNSHVSPVRPGNQRYGLRTPRRYPGVRAPGHCCVLDLHPVRIIGRRNVRRFWLVTPAALSGIDPRSLQWLSTKVLRPPRPAERRDLRLDTALRNTEIGQNGS